MSGARLPSAAAPSKGTAPAALAWSEARADARARTMTRSPLLLLPVIMGVADMAVVFACGLTATLLRPAGGSVPADTSLVAAFAGLLAVNAITLSGGYALRGRPGFTSLTGRAIQAWTAVFLLLIIAGYLTKTLETYSRLWAVGWYLSALIGLGLVRVAGEAKLRRLRRSGRLASTVAVVDLCGQGADFARRLVRESVDLRLLGVFFSPPASIAPASGPIGTVTSANDNTETEEDAGPDRSRLADLIALSRLFRIDDVLVLVSGERPGTDVPAVLRLLGTIPANIRLCPVLPELAHAPIRDAAMWHDRAVLTVHHRPLGGWSSTVKRAEDLVLGGVMAVVLAPLMLIIAAAVKIDSRGPVLFRQPRQGFNHNVFTVLKFRSMVQEAGASHEVKQATRNDSRVTRLGRILRRTSLDELPQILNVLRGDMSLVGPRPHAIVHNELYSGLIDDYLGRHRVQPGITGWAQVNGLRGETETLDKMQRRVEFDLNYIDNWSVWLDLKIIFYTALSVLRDSAAY